MARVSRTRTRVVTFSRGRYMYYNGPTLVTDSGYSTRSFTESCFDSHGRPIADSPLTVDAYKGKCPSVTGNSRASSNHNLITFLDAYDVGSYPSGFTSLVALSAPSGWMLDLVAGTNPSRPVIEIPLFIQDIVELPKMILSLGKLLRDPKSKFTPKGLASEYLGVKFGWLPLIDDLTALLGVQSAIIKRSKELSQLYSGKGIRRRLKFSDDTTTTSSTALTSLYFTGILTMNYSLTVKRSSWATIRWKPSTPPSYHPDDETLNRLATRLVLGATPESLAKGVWDVIPWTWLIGWFTNLGKYTLAYSWTVPATHSSGCFMSKVEALLVPSGVSTTNTYQPQYGVDGSLTHTLSTRSVGSAVTPGANMPLIDMSRLSVLGALFVQRFLR
jgi:hypothetical protein